MKEAVVIIGIGQMGAVFARGFLSIGHPVYPVIRAMEIESISDEYPDPALALVAVAEADLDGVLRQLPEGWKRRVGLLQNELLPKDWQKHGIEDPTVIAAWFEKKFRRAIAPLVPSPVYGPQAELVVEALSAIEIPVKTLGSYEELVEALVVKNLYILTANIAGLKGADTVGGLLEQDLKLTEEVFDDVMTLQQSLTGRAFDRDTLWKEMVSIIHSDPEHGSRGRSAPQRLVRALQQAEAMGLELETLSKISQDGESRRSRQTKAVGSDEPL